ncbi:MAG: hypothetical protein WCD72_05945 [Dehalococcoidia bacterium]
MLTAVVRVLYRALEDLLLRLSRARFAINEAIIWCQATLRSAVAVKAAAGCTLEVELGGHVPTVMALATNGNEAR